MPQCFKRIGLAEKAGHMDENVVIESPHLHRLRPQVLHILIESIDPVQTHPARNAPPDGSGLVQIEVDTRESFEQAKDLLVTVQVLQHIARIRQSRGALGIRQASDPAKLLGDCSGRQDKIHAASFNGIFRHAGRLGGCGVLGDRNPASCFDRLETQGAVRAGSRKDNADGVAPLVPRQGFKELVDRQVPASVGPACDEPQHPSLDHHVPVRRDDVDTVRHHLVAVVCLGDVHARR